MADTVLALPEGWLTEAEAATLAELAKGRLVVEVGSWLGRSTVCMARTAKLVVAVDHHHGPPYDGEGSTLIRFLANLAQHEIHNVVPVLADSVIALSMLQRRFDLAFIDGGHETPDVIRDGLAAWGVVVAGGHLAFHDYGQHDGVRPAVEELCRRWGARVESRTESLAIVVRKVG